MMLVDPTFLAIGAVTFLVVLILILRNGAKEEPKKASKKDKKQKTPQTKQQKPKKGRDALKKKERASFPSEWQVVDSAARDASEVLEFLKGKDPNEIAKQHATATKPATKKKAPTTKKTKDEVQSSEDSATDDGSYEGFEEVKKKAPTDNKKKKKEKKGEEKKEQKEKPYFRALNPDGTPVKDEKAAKRERKPRKPDADGAPQPEGQLNEGEKRERKPRPEGDGEKREPRERKEGDGERKREPRPPREPREPREERRPVTSAPNVKHEEQLGIDEILNSMTKEFKSKKKPTTREPSNFSRIERELVKRILSSLAARDLVAVSAVNHHLSAASRNDDLWRRLCFRDFGVKDKDFKNKTFKAVYKAEHQKKKPRKTKKDDATAPQGEEKDTKGKQEEKDTKGKQKEQASKEVKE